MKKLLVVAALTLLGSPTWAAASPSTPLAQAKTLVEVLQKVVNPAAEQRLTAEQTQANKKIFSLLDTLIDFKKLTDGPVKPHRKSLSKKQISIIKKLFKDAIRNIAYPKSGSFFSGAELTWGKAIANGKDVDIPLDIFVEEEDLEVGLLFHWTRVGKAWKLFDLSIDDASLVKDYQNQFGKIIQEEGAQSLVDKLEKRLNEAQKKHGTLS